MKKLKNFKINKVFSKRQKSYIVFRLNLLFFIIFVLFVSLVVRLLYMQIIDSKKYQKYINDSNHQIVQVPAPRGQIYDAKENILAKNTEKIAIVYTRNKGTTLHEMRQTAFKLIDLINIPSDPQITKRDKRDFWLADEKNFKKIQAKLNKKEKYDKNNTPFPERQIWETIVSKVDIKELNYDDKTLSAATVFKNMNAVSELNTITVFDENVSQENIAQIAEHKEELPGISTSNNWETEFEDSALRPILGNISSEKSGLPKEKLKKYLAKGYARNDRVGTSGLEEQYESILQGKKQKTKVIINNEGKIIRNKIIQKAQSGDNLKLTIDKEFQQKIQDLLSTKFNSMVFGQARYAKGAYAVAMNPKTGGIYAIAGVSHNIDTGEVYEDVLGAINNSFVPGSVVKGATVTAGYETKVISGNETLTDIPIQIKGTPVKQSIFYSRFPNKILSVTEALENSSNSFMMQLTLKMLGVNYIPNMGLPETNKEKVYKELRAAFNQYGLGVKTRVDLPKEAIGLKGNTKEADAMGKLLDLSFGQYDMYTTMQLAQYAATIANGGHRIKPHFVEGIYENGENGRLGKIKKKIEPTILNDIPISEAQMDIIRTGFYNVVHGKSFYTTAVSLRNTKMTVSAKTGTAETSVTVNDQLYETINMSIVAYGPSNPGEESEIAVALIIPNLIPKDNVYPNQEIVRSILDLYYDTYSNLH
ncbi:MAG: penicillin-binding protein 2 [Streptococcaceae bacterium]|jgi:penicillin-binding protein 2B|nr:penicillin-binding protein 2 [Streptococcaceae bacterium]